MAKKKKPGDDPRNGGRASDATIEQRVLVVLQLKLDGAQPWDIRRYVSEKEVLGEVPWTMDADRKPLSERTIQRYMTDADTRISAICLTQEKNAIHLHFAQRRGLYAEAKLDRDFRTALAVLQDLAHLADLYPAAKTKNEHTGKDGTELPRVMIYLPENGRTGNTDDAANDGGQVETETPTAGTEGE